MVISDVKIKVINPNTNRQLEQALSDMIAYQLACNKIEEMEKEKEST
ncbi:MAG: hypothetical protein IJJ82_03150 [Clostridia bacterium]|nr:hypothetical protein [Clostridia bacterium]